MEIMDVNCLTFEKYINYVIYEKYWLHLDEIVLHFWTTFIVLLSKWEQFDTF